MNRIKDPPPSTPPPRPAGASPGVLLIGLVERLVWFGIALYLGIQLGGRTLVIEGCGEDIILEDQEEPAPVRPDGWEM